MVEPEPFEPQKTESVWSVFATYDVTTKRPKDDITKMFRDLSISLGNELRTLRDDHEKSSVALAAAHESISGLQNRLRTLRRIQFFAGALSLIGAVLIGFGVNYLTADQPTLGWTTLGLGILMELGSLGTTLVDRD